MSTAVSRQGVGTKLMDIIKMQFIDRNKTGCRYLVVDAYNETGVTDFYERNGFQYLTNEDVEDKTRAMGFDLILFLNAQSGVATNG